MAVKVAGCQTQGIHKHAHDSGDGETIYHCPFCGSGQVIARSDRTIECQFCHTCFTVQVQPQFPAFPQTINGQPVQVPGMPGQIGAGADPMDPMGGGMPPVDPSQVDEEGEVPPGEEDPAEGDEEGDEEGDDAPPWAKQSSLLRTPEGHLITADDFRRRLAIRHASDSARMAKVVKETR